jgi:tetratricopeptide (TPR) repeat protein
MKDIFALQDEITLEIIKALQIELTGGERARVVAKGTNNLEAYLKLLQGQEAFHNWSPGHTEKARAIAREVIALDPDYPKGYALLARTLLREVRHGRSDSPSASIEQAFQLAQKVLNIDESDIDAHIVLGNIYLRRSQNEIAIAELEKAVSLNPNSTEAISALGRMLLRLDKPQRALELFQRAIRLDPIYAKRASFNLGQTHRYLGQYEEAILLFKKIAQDEPDIFGLTLELIVCFTAVGKKKEAEAQVAKLLDMEPSFSLRKLSMRIPIRNLEPKKTYLDLLRKAGLPD